MDNMVDHMPGQRMIFQAGQQFLSLFFKIFLANASFLLVGYFGDGIVKNRFGITLMSKIVSNGAKEKSHRVIRRRVLYDRPKIDEFYSAFPRHFQLPPPLFCLLNHLLFKIMNGLEDSFPSVIVLVQLPNEVIVIHVGATGGPVIEPEERRNSHVIDHTPEVAEVFDFHLAGEREFQIAPPGQRGGRNPESPFHGLLFIQHEYQLVFVSRSNIAQLHPHLQAVEVTQFPGGVEQNDILQLCVSQGFECFIESREYSLEFFGGRNAGHVVFVTRFLIFFFAFLGMLLPLPAFSTFLQLHFGIFLLKNGQSRIVYYILKSANFFFNRVVLLHILGFWRFRHFLRNSVQGAQGRILHPLIIQSPLFIVRNSDPVRFAVTGFLVGIEEFRQSGQSRTACVERTVIKELRTVAAPFVKLLDEIRAVDPFRKRRKFIRELFPDGLFDKVGKQTAGKVDRFLVRWAWFFRAVEPSNDVPQDVTLSRFRFEFFQPRDFSDEIIFKEPFKRRHVSLDEFFHEFGVAG